MPLNNPPVVTLYTSGSYAGDNTANRAIPHGLRAVPRLVLIANAVTTSQTGMVADGENINLSNDVHQAVTSWDGTDFYVTNPTVGFNTTGQTYFWVAFT